MTDDDEFETLDAWETHGPELVRKRMAEAKALAAGHVAVLKEVIACLEAGGDAFYHEPIQDVLQVRAGRYPREDQIIRALDALKMARLGELELEDEGRA